MIFSYIFLRISYICFLSDILFRILCIFSGNAASFNGNTSTGNTSTGNTSFLFFFFAFNVNVLWMCGIAGTTSHKSLYYKCPYLRLHNIHVGKNPSVFLGKLKFLGEGGGGPKNNKIKKLRKKVLW